MKLLLLLFLFASCSSVFYYPTRILYSNPRENGFNFENHYIDSDGYKLHSWFFKTKHTTPKGLVVLFHGNAQNLSSHYLNLVWLIREGYDFFIFDYRSYGINAGLPSQKGLYRDALASMEYAHKLKKERNAPKLIFYGQSLGGAVLSRALVDSPITPDGLILESTFHSYQRMAVDKLPWALKFMGHTLVSDEYASTKYLGKIEVKTLVMHGTRDPIVPVSNAMEIFDRLTTSKELYLVKDAAHIDAYHRPDTQKDSRKKLLSFLESL